MIGDFAWDVLIRTNTELLRGGDTFGEVMLMPGGSAANVAVWAARCGLDTALHRQDRPRPHGAAGAARTSTSRTSTSHLVESDAHLTGSVAVFVDHTGERSMVSGHGADFYLLPSELPRERDRARPAPAPDGVVVLHRSAAYVGVASAARIAQDAGATLSFDPGSFQMIQEMGVDHFIGVTRDLGIDVFLPNKEEGAILTGLKDRTTIAHELTELYPGALVILQARRRRGAGVARRRAHHTSRRPPTTWSTPPVPATRSPGRFLARYLVGATPVEAATFATSISAWVIEHPGARPRPTRARRG